MWSYSYLAHPLPPVLPLSISIHLSQGASGRAGPPGNQGPRGNPVSFLFAFLVEILILILLYSFY